MIHTIGSINIDRVYRVPHLPRPGETVAALGFETGLGGKGANQSLAAAAAGAAVRHAGCVGPDGAWCRDALAEAGIDVSAVATVAEATGHAIVQVDPDGENAITIHPGANRALTRSQIETAIADARDGWALIQNETNLTTFAAEAAKRRGLPVAYAAAPFELEATQALLAHLDLLACNEGEAAALSAALGKPVAEAGPREVLVTRGGAGAVWSSGAERIEVPVFPVDAVDTTGAGDTFLGAFLAQRDAGIAVADALRFAAAAAALQVSRPGAAAAIPKRAEIEAFLADRDA